jgi:hypothetical protein
MPQEEIPRVSFATLRGSQMGFAVGWLKYINGRPWFFHREEDIDKTPLDVGALELDPSLLEAGPTPESGPPIYAYRAKILLPPE